MTCTKLSVLSAIQCAIEHVSTRRDVHESTAMTSWITEERMQKNDNKVYLITKDSKVNPLVCGSLDFLLRSLLPLPLLRLDMLVAVVVVIVECVAVTLCCRDDILPRLLAVSALARQSSA